MTVEAAGVSAQRIPNLPPERWTPEVEALFPIMLPPGSAAKGSDFNSILLLAHHPALAGPWLEFNAKIARGFTISARQKEIAILRAPGGAGPTTSGSSTCCRPPGLGSPSKTSMRF